MLAAILYPIGRELAASGRIDEALGNAERALMSVSLIDDEQSRSRALADVACIFARCGRIVRAKAIADDCPRALDRLRAYTAIVAAGAPGGTARRGRHVHNATVDDMTAAVPTKRDLPRVVFKNAQAFPLELRAEVEDVAIKFLNYMALVGFERGKPIAVIGGGSGYDVDIDKEKGTVKMSAAAARSATIVEVAITSILLTGTTPTQVSSDLDSLVFYYPASFENSSTLRIPGEDPVDLSSSAMKSAPVPEDLRVLVALWDLRSTVGASVADKLVWASLDGIRAGTTAVDTSAFFASILSHSQTIGADGAKVRDVLKRRGLIVSPHPTS